MKVQSHHLGPLMVSTKRSRTKKIRNPAHRMAHTIRRRSAHVTRLSSKSSGSLASSRATRSRKVDALGVERGEYSCVLANSSN